jgi:hypothetical protein
MLQSGREGPIGVRPLHPRAQCFPFERACVGSVGAALACTQGARPGRAVAELINRRADPVVVRWVLRYLAGPWPVSSSAVPLENSGPPW